MDIKEFLRWVAGAFIFLFLFAIHWVLAVAFVIAVLCWYPRARRRKLAEQFKQLYHLPLPENWDISKDRATARRVKYYIKEYPKHSGSDLYDLKLRAFYEICVPAEAMDSSVSDAYRELGKQTSTDIQLLRSDKNETEILNGAQLEIELAIADKLKSLKTNKLKGCAEKLKSLKEADTSGLFGFTSRSKVEEQTKAMQRIVRGAYNECEKLQEFTPIMNRLLTEVRIAAYRNIYLSLELLGIIRENVGGSTLTTQKDQLDVVDVDLQSVNYDAGELTMDSLAVLSTGAMSALEVVGNNDTISQWAGENPKTAMAGAAIMAGLGYLAARNEVIENNLNMQKKLVKDLDNIAELYVQNKAGIRRSLEIIKAIVNANKGFIAIYAPLREKVFEQNGAKQVSMKELQQLVLATNEYNKITKSKIK